MLCIVIKIFTFIRDTPYCLEWLDPKFHNSLMHKKFMKWRLESMLLFQRRKHSDTDQAAWFSFQASLDPYVIISMGCYPPYTYV